MNFFTICPWVRIGRGKQTVQGKKSEKKCQMNSSNQHLFSFLLCFLPLRVVFSSTEPHSICRLQMICEFSPLMQGHDTPSVKFLADCEEKQLLKEHFIKNIVV